MTQCRKRNDTYHNTASVRQTKRNKSLNVLIIRYWIEDGVAIHSDAYKGRPTINIFLPVLQLSNQTFCPKFHEISAD